MRTQLPIRAHKQVEHAVARMLASRETYQPFVILEHEPTGCFVQFCGSNVLELVFDVPAFGITEQMGRPGMDELEAIVARAYSTLAHLVALRYAERGLNGPASIEMSQELVLEERVPEAATA